MKAKNRHSILIALYVAKSVAPYVLLAWFILTAILLAQQANRFAELLLVAQLPSSLTGEVFLSLLPNVTAFAMPTAMLFGVLIGMSRMGGDSEVIAMRAAGVGTWSLVRAPLCLGVGVAALMLYVVMEVGPSAAENLRRVGLRAALYKLDSPVEPKSFNTDLPGRVIYVREGDKIQGEWEKVFIYSVEPGGETSVVTARSGRIDFSAEQSELVLSDARRSILAADGNSLVTESLAQMRVKLTTNRVALLRRLQSDAREPEEMNGVDLRQRGADQSIDAKERFEAQLLFHRRLTLAAAPVVFALLGAGLGLRVRRGGRATGLLASLIVLLAYYLASLGGEQLARTNKLPVVIGLWAATALTFVVGVAMCALASRRFNFSPRKLWPARTKALAASDKISQNLNPTRPRNKNLSAQIEAEERSALSGAIAGRIGLLSLLDRSLFRALIGNFTLATVAFVAIFVIFTVFEVWKYVATTGAGPKLIARYVFYLVPLALVALAPTGALVAVLATYALLARRSEALAWWASGQSVYRLALPALLFAVLIGGGVWVVQERVMPRANQRQDALRAQIRSGVSKTEAPIGRQWLSAISGKRIYAFEYDDAREELLDPLIFEFDAESVHVEKIVAAGRARWAGESLILSGESGKRTSGGRGWTVGPGPARTDDVERIAAVESPSVFKPTLNRPSQLSTAELSTYIQLLKARGSATPDLAVALARKQIEPFYPTVMALLAVPFAIWFGRRSAVAALAAAIGIGVAFWIVSSGVQQLGLYALLPAQVAAWSPAVIFSMIGVYLLSRAKT